jgi:tryptophan synthase alpha chain
MAGDPDEATSLAVLDALIKGGADIVEIGVPFTDPVADGPSIQNSGERALKAGSDLGMALRLASTLRERHPETGIVLMGYANTFLQKGEAAFANSLAGAGVDASIIVDLPLEEDAALRRAAAEHGLHVIRLIAPTTPHERIARLAADASGFLYGVARAGVTGGARDSDEALDPMLKAMRAARPDLPIALGFGVRTHEDAAATARLADGVIVGSAIADVVGAAEAANAAEEARTLVSTLYAGVARRDANETGEAA